VGDELALCRGRRFAGVSATSSVVERACGVWIYQSLLVGGRQCAYHRQIGGRWSGYGPSYCFYYGSALRVSGGDGYLPDFGSSVYQLTWFRMGRGVADGSARRVI